MNAGVTAPEPWRDLPPAYLTENVTPDLYADQGGTELSWGAGLVAPMYNGSPPGPGNDYAGPSIGTLTGGQYMPKCPRVDPPKSGVGMPRQHYQPGEARGYPGDPVRR
jgi:hypothetical protein